MNILSRSSHPICASSRPKTRVVLSNCSARVAKRFFTEKHNLYPLHAAARNNDSAQIQNLLKNGVTKVNAIDNQGELPLGIAAKQYQKAPNEQKKILRTLHDFGACYLLKDGRGQSPLQHLEAAQKKLPSDLVEMQINADALTHMLTGCGQNITGCLFRCKKKSGNYTPELKATVALQSLSTSLSIQELAYLHGVAPSEVIEWRRHAREGLIDLFKDSDTL